MDDFEIRDGVLVKYHGNKARVKVPQEVRSIGREAFDSCEKMKSITFPKGLKRIDERAFRWCKNLKSITLPESLEHLGSYAFWGCRGLESVHLPQHLQNIEDGVFWACTSLKDLELPEGVQSIGWNACKDCWSLESIVLTERLQHVEVSAFQNCRSLCLYLPESLANISQDWFGDLNVRLVSAPGVPMASIRGHQRKMRALGYFCRGQEQGIVYRDTEGYRKYAGRQHDAPELLDLALEMPSVLRYFLKEKLLQLADVDALLEKVQDDTERKAVLLDYLHANFTEADRGAQEDRELAKVLTGILSAAEARKSWTYETAADKSVCITGYKGPETEVVIPRGIGRRMVTEVWLEADAAKRQEMTRLIVPKEIRLLGGFWLGRRYGVEIVVEEGNPRYRNVDGALIDTAAEKLYQCPLGAGTSFVVPGGIRHIGGFAFSKCQNLQSITLPEGLESIDMEAFSDCTSLKEIRLPESVQSIGDDAFSRCTSLESILLPEGLEQIGQGMFSGCTGLQHIALPESVKSIGDDAFSHCTSLENIVLPERLQELGEDVFADCSALQSIRLPESMTEIPEPLFSLPDACLVIAPGVPMTNIRGHRRKLTALTHFCRAQEQGIVYRDTEGYRKYAGRQHDSWEVQQLALETPGMLRYFLREKLLRLPDVNSMLLREHDPMTGRALRDYREELRNSSAQTAGHA